MNKTILTAITAWLAVSLAGCAAIISPLDEGYQFGDLTGSLLAVQAEYCATADPYRRAALAAVLRSQGIGLPSGGACTQLITLLPPPKQEAVDQALVERKRVQRHRQE